MSGYQKLSSKYVYHGRSVRVRVDGVRLPSGKVTTRDVIEHDGAVAVIAIDENGDLILERQFRYAAGKELLEIPAGGIDPGETPEQTAYREMQEETGYAPGKLEKLTGFYAAPGYASEYLHLFLATDLKPARLTAEDTDEIELIRVQLDIAVEMIRAGDIQDAKSIAGILFYLKFKSA
jgi:ADP-ribose diphosphatase